VVELRALGKTMAETSAITGCARTYCSTLLKKLSARPEQVAALPRGGRPKGVPGPAAVAVCAVDAGGDSRADSGSLRCAPVDPRRGQVSVALGLYTAEVGTASVRARRGGSTGVAGAVISADSRTCEAGKGRDLLGR